MPFQKSGAAPTIANLLFERAEVGLCVVAADGSVLRANAEWVRSTGRSPGEVLGAEVLDLFPATRDLALAQHARAGHRVRVPRHARRIDGRETWWEGSIDPLSMEGGTGLLISVRDVTSTEEALRASIAAERWSSVVLRAVTDSIPDPVYVKDAEGRLLFANPATLHATGKTSQQVIGHTDPEIFEDAAVGAAIAETDRRIRESGETVAVEERIQTPDGYKVFLSTKAPLRDEVGTVLGLIGVSRDVTERKRAEEALRGSEERLRAAFMASPDAININRLRDGAYASVNQRFEQLSLWSRAEVIGKTAADLDLWVDREEREHLMARLVSEGAIQRAETALRRRDGSVFTASISAQTFEADGERFLLAVTRDISDLKRAEQALKDANHRKDEFLAMLSHELRNPLTPLRNAAYIMEHADPGGSQAVRARGVLRRQSEHLTRLVDDLLDVTRIARSKMSLLRSRIDLRDVLERAAEDVRPTMAERGISFRIALPGTRVEAHADPTRLNQVLANLLHNASKFTPRGGEVVLSLRPAGTTAEIRVRDTGVGIDLTALPLIFDAFMQAERTVARSEGGLGLGLALVKGITELHGGEVSAVSAGIGRGAEFVVRLPIEEGELAAPSEEVPAHREGHRWRVLVVDDNADAAESLAEILRMFGHEVYVASDGPTALAKLGSSRPDIVLADIGLPGMNGYELAKTIRASGSRDVQLVALTAHAQADDVRQAIEAGFDAHVAKPPDPEELANLLARRSPRAANHGRVTGSAPAGGRSYGQ
jgi:PAS domain S-box-containing protein